MFGTWRYGSQNKGDTFLRQSIDSASGRATLQQACNSCRAKKVKCTGEKKGCSRCKSLSTECVYVDSRRTARRRPSYSQKKSSGQENSPKDSNAEAQGSQAENPTAFEEPDLQKILMWDDVSTEPRKLAAHAETPVEYGEQAQDASNATPPAQLHWGNWTHVSEDAEPGGPDRYGDELAMASLDPASHAAWPDPSLPPKVVTSNWFVGPPSTRPAPKQCPCLARVVFLLDELESPDHGAAAATSGRDSVDAVLASNKEMLQHAQAMVECRSCMSKIENVTLLTFLLDRLAKVCQSVAVLYQKWHSEKRSSTAAWPPSPLSLGGEAGSGGSGFCGGSGFGGGGGARDLCVGEYKMDAPGEWDAVMRTLLLLQVQQLERLVKSIKGATVVGGSESLLRRLRMADARLEALCSGPWAAS